MSRWSWLLLKIARKLWFRAALFSALAVLTALLSAVLASYIPYQITATIGAEAVDQILSILASSMLAVTTFSLTTMVQAYAAATSNVTPRATVLLIEDRTAQNAMSTFLGTFLYSIVGIVALSTGIYGENGRVILFVVTIAVIAWIVVTLLRWIGHLSYFGQVGETTRRVEEQAEQGIQHWIDTPYMGGRPAVALPVGARPIYPTSTGYIEHIDMGGLSDAMEAAVGELHLTELPGAYVHTKGAIAWMTGSVDEERLASVRGAFTIGPARTYGHDPRVGLIVLAEIASRALSPGINDPGTAISVIGAATRILIRWADALPLPVADEPRYPRIFVPPLSTFDLFDDAFRPIARDGAAMVEVGIRLQKSLAILALQPSVEVQSAARHQSREALARFKSKLDIENDIAILEDLARHVEASRVGAPDDLIRSGPRCGLTADGPSPHSLSKA